MSKEAPVIHEFCECRNRGDRTQMRRSIVRQFGAGGTIEVIQYVCPACGYTKIVRDTHGKRNVSSAEYAAAEQYGNDAT